RPCGGNLRTRYRYCSGQDDAAPRHDPYIQAILPRPAHGVSVRTRADAMDNEAHDLHVRKHAGNHSVLPAELLMGLFMAPLFFSHPAANRVIRVTVFPYNARQRSMELRCTDERN